ncbi:hypothetical protein [Pedobacter panaciterrae]|uniref:hypothetical protein n=1 Tax=Pedobacter panaciterrae TaxID=363849 RepID=UPI00259ADF06|nr:hypothetical protein [uncultured Pedobacter sp.]
MNNSSDTNSGRCWHLEYRDTVRLLQEKLWLFVRVNPKLRDNVRDINRFMTNTAEAIEIDLSEFSDVYQQKFIQVDPDRYCLNFIELLCPVLGAFVKEVGYVAHGFKFCFRYDKKVLEVERTVFALNPGR